MPPWPPEEGFGEFANERRLSQDQVDLIGQWVSQGSVEGDPRQGPPPPSFPDGWLLGKPDLIVTLPKPFHLGAEGKDVYRNFVIPASGAGNHYVRGIEFRPGNNKVVHHAFIKVDSTSESRRLDGKEPEPGFGGMNTPAEMPDGHFLTWQPGKLPSFEPDGLAWRLGSDDDIVLQVHFRPSGKPETVQPSLALYFTEQAPTNRCFKIALTSLTVDIPPGQDHYVVEDSFALPVGAQVLAVLPHAHYLARRMEAWATLPDGSRRWLLTIKDWDFNWQGDYRYAPPIALPKGTTLAMRYSYDNSAHNPRNPHQPPQRVTYGPQSSDEMAELWLQLLPRNTNELSSLNRAYQAKMIRTFMAREQYLLGLNPMDAEAHTHFGQLLLGQGRFREAEAHLRTACQINPNDDQAHYFLGLALRQENQLPQARTEFEEALLRNPQNFKAHGNLGLIAAEQGDYQRSEYHFREALKINPYDQLAQDSLNELLNAIQAKPTQH
jgi:hypothetical protein